jgi:hypothetical protein
MNKQDKLKQISFEELRKEILEGAEQIRRGKYKAYKSADEFMNDIEKRISERLTKGRTA